ncbi:MAG: electron transfer flavoprotein subunit alpha/FixB family protein [Chloroflexi bacterium]|nr:electron transfer flavoprotein subunit alpha/FixB family protein [Chloroflexota bacterium]
MSEPYTGIIAVCEDRETLLELLGQGRELADTLKVWSAAVVLGEHVEPAALDLSRWGADKVYMIENPALKHFNVEAYTDALVALSTQVKPALILLGATKRGLELAPRVAERLKVGCVSGCVGLDVEAQSRQIIIKAMVYSGIANASYHCKSKPALATVLPRTFEKKEVNDRNAEVVRFPLEITEPRLKVVSVEPKATSGERIETAAVIVDAGQGIKKKEDLKMLEELATLLGGHMTCTRPLSSDRDWFPEWLGLSGKKVSPDLCITVGVSGAIQHMVGIRQSKIIAAINNDEDSAIFTQADYGVVGNLYEYVPALIEALKKRII